VSEARHQHTQQNMNTCSCCGSSTGDCSVVGSWPEYTVMLSLLTRQNLQNPAYCCRSYLVDRPGEGSSHRPQRPAARLPPPTIPPAAVQQPLLICQSLLLMGRAVQVHHVLQVAQCCLCAGDRGAGQAPSRRDVWQGCVFLHRIQPTWHDQAACRRRSNQDVKLGDATKRR
jgi:hypothetical protein